MILHLFSVYFVLKPVLIFINPKDSAMTFPLMETKAHWSLAQFLAHWLIAIRSLQGCSETLPPRIRYSFGVQFTEMGEENRTKARTLDSDLSTSQGIQPAGRRTLVGLSGFKKDNSKVPQLKP